MCMWNGKERREKDRKGKEKDAHSVCIYVSRTLVI